MYVLYPAIIIFVRNWRLQSVMCSGGGVMWLEMILFIFAALHSRAATGRRTSEGDKVCRVEEKLQIINGFMLRFYELRL